MLRMSIDGVTATATEKEVLTAGRVGLKCAFEFGSGDWGGLFKTAVFQGIETVDVALPENECTVPWEALAVEGVQLKVGVYGANGDGDIVVPTVWANFGKIQPSATPSGVDPQNPSQNANAYAVETAEQALAIAQSVRDDADNGDFDGAPGYSPSASVSKVGDTATITITDENGTTTASISDGADGAAGAAATIAVGTTTTVAAGLPASVTNSGTSSAAVFDFSIPKGADGESSQIWYTTTAPSKALNVYTFSASNLGPSRLASPAVGDLVIYNNYCYIVTSVSGTSVISDNKNFSIKGDTGAAGQGVAAGGTTGQVLKKKSGTDYDTEWANESGGGGTPYTSNPEMDGEASPGSSDELSRGDHVHPSDTSRQAKITASGILKGDGNGGVTAATAGTDYLVTAPVTSVNSKTGAVSLGASDVGAIAAPASPSADDVLTYSSGSWVAAAPAHQIPAGGNAGECLAKNSASDYDLRWRTINDWTPAGLMRTAGGTAAKVAEWSFWTDTQYPAWLLVTVGNSNTYAGAITLKVNGKGPYPIYINGAASSSSNYTLPAGSYFVYFDGSKFDFRTDGKIPGDITGHAADPTEVTVSTAGAVTQALDAGKIYHFTGALTALTITLNAASGLAHYHFDFDCGSTAPTVTIPNTVTMPSGNFEADKHYEVDILNNYGAVLSWATS